ncbi:hypothetical protein AAG614_10795 [Citromicrobium bathyomarinum]|uniref:hypothetical protein n=1 Tax=Sphingomonadales TaxID=204457 RepID=UPI0001DD0B3F|nr:MULTISPECIES: hypothetical protein [Sphingomonadales]ALG60251.1 hypothetical protein WG74_04830 [Citromicrobium sp. JL477]KPM18919.1 hypothetical protein VO58_02200 [Citromicrobium sp. JL1351]KPM20623.1 hypothetical protein VM77_02730 [Citromicrobium sp. JL31]KPM29907.1 hypothetical protein VO57_02200 [Citromicrobium sp. JL2201]MCD1623243.1 hypothetical protein [Citromicrobium bathyomarinum]
MNSKKLLLGGALLAAVPVSSASGAGGGGKGAAEDLIDMEAIAVPIVDGAKLQGTLRFRIVLEAHDAEAAKEIAAELPGLRAEALATGAEFSRLRASPFLAVDAQRLSDELTEALHARYEGIDRVLLVEVAARTS